jgi:gas vesicle protein
MWNTNKAESQRTVWMALVAGAGAGLAVGLLTAPKAGRKLRTEIGEAVDDYLDSARGKAEELARRGMNEVRKTRTEASDSISNAVDVGAKEAHNAIDQTLAAAHVGAKKGHEVVDKAADSAKSGVRA